jgi:hypothetical protein
MCSSKSDPNEKNFTPVINQLFTQNNLACLPGNSYPTDLPASTSEKDDPVGFEYRKFLDSLVNAGLLKSIPVPAGKAKLLPGPALRYQLTDSGLKYFHPDAADTPDARSGELCYGHLSFGKVIRWDAPVKLGDYQGTSVYYTYRIDDLADWAKRSDVQAASRQLRETVNGIGTREYHYAVTLTNEGWRLGN